MLSLKSTEHVRLQKEKVSNQEGCKGAGQVSTRARTERRKISIQNKRFEADHTSEFRGHDKEKKGWILGQFEQYENRMAGSLCFHQRLKKISVSR